MVQPALQTLSDNTIRELYKSRFTKKRGERLQSSAVAAEHARAFLATLTSDQEHFCCVFLDAQNQIISTELMSSGGISSAAVFPRVIIKRMLDLESTSLICFHNHPSGETKPSQSDKALTKKLDTALKSIDCQLLDHLVIGDGYLSFCDEGLL